MLLAIDIGNSNIKFALFEGEMKRAFWRLATVRQRTVDEYGTFIAQTFAQRGIALEEVKALIVSSVVPEATPPVQKPRSAGCSTCRCVTVAEVLERLPIKCLVDRPQDVGSDRLGRDYGGTGALQTAFALIVDFGTATTFTLIDAEGNYQGGAIAPGVNTALDALTAKAAAKLPQIFLKAPPGVWAKNTIHAVQSGSWFGTISMVEGMILRLTEAFGGFSSIVLSGGLSSFFKDQIKGMTVCNPSLNLTGLRLIHEHIQTQ